MRRTVMLELALISVLGGAFLVSTEDVVATKATHVDLTTLINNAINSSNYTNVREELKSWFLQMRKEGPVRDRWGPQVPRIAVALHLADNSTFSPGNRTGKEIRYELTTQILSHLRREESMSSPELALYIHGLLVSCQDPRDFYGHDLVHELIKRIEAPGNYTNPFLILVLCNAGEVMTPRDVERVVAAYKAKYRPFWTDTQALAIMALSCISSRNGSSLTKGILEDMLQELKGHQDRNGTVSNLKTTALATQALFIHDSYRKAFDLDAAIKALVNGLKGSKSFLDAYYSLPVLHGKSLLNVNSKHCSKDLVKGLVDAELSPDNEIISGYKNALQPEGKKYLQKKNTS